LLVALVLWQAGAAVECSAPEVMELLTAVLEEMAGAAVVVAWLMLQVALAVMVLLQFAFIFEA
jgi:hypothetical protein